VLFNLTVTNRKKYHDIDASILPFFKRKWKSLQGPNNNLKMSKLSTDFLGALLIRNKTRYYYNIHVDERGIWKSGGVQVSGW
jgi:hypothetical protein